MSTVFNYDVKRSKYYQKLIRYGTDYIYSDENRPLEPWEWELALLPLETTNFVCVFVYFFLIAFFNCTTDVCPHHVEQISMGLSNLKNLIMNPMRR